MHFRVEDTVGVPASLLDRIHCLVGVLNKILNIIGMIGIQADSDAGADRTILPGVDDGKLQSLQYLAGDDFYILLRCDLLEDNNELIPAYSGRYFWRFDWGRLCLVRRVSEKYMQLAIGLFSPGSMCAMPLCAGSFHPHYYPMVNNSICGRVKSTGGRMLGIFL